MHDETERADHREQQEPQRHHVMGEFREHEPEEIQRHHGIELALAVQPRAERVRDFLGAERALGGRHHVEQDLEALRRQLRRKFFEAIAADHEEAAHGIGDLDPQRPLGDLGRERAGARPLAIETVRAAAFDIAAADHEIELAALQERKHLRQLRFVVLQVGIDDRRVRRARRQNALDAGAGETAPPDPADAAHAAVLARQRPQHLPGAVGRIVVDKDRLERDAGQRLFQPPKQRDDIVPLVEGRDHDRKLR